MVCYLLSPNPNPKEEPCWELSMKWLDQQSWSDIHASLQISRAACPWYCYFSSWSYTQTLRTTCTCWPQRTHQSRRTTIFGKIHNESDSIHQPVWDVCTYHMDTWQELPEGAQHLKRTLVQACQCRSATNFCWKALAWLMPMSSLLLAPCLASSVLCFPSLLCIALKVLGDAVCGCWSPRLSRVIAGFRFVQSQLHFCLDWMLLLIFDGWLLLPGYELAATGCFCTCVRFNPLSCCNPRR